MSEYKQELMSEGMGNNFLEYMQLHYEPTEVDNQEERVFLNELREHYGQWCQENELKPIWGDKVDDKSQSKHLAKELWEFELNIKRDSSDISRRRHYVADIRLSDLSED